MADVVMPPAPPSTPCQFDKAWVGKCGKPTDNGYCSEHEAKKCVVCGAQATHGCDYTGMSALVCGAPLCATCHHEPYNKQTTPFPWHHLNAADYTEAVEAARRVRETA